MTDACGFQNERKIAASRLAKSQKPTAITTSSENIRAMAILLHAIFHHVQRRKFATKAAAWVPADAVFTSILRMRSNGLGNVIRERYGNLFEVYEKITGEDAYKVPMRIYPAVHYTMGGLWVDYNLMSNVPGLFVIGEANFSDHGANRLGASALMQGLADGYFILPYTLPNYLAGQMGKRPSPGAPEFQEAEENAQ